MRLLKGQQGDEGTQPSVAPRVGAFIERIYLRCLYMSASVAPRVGAFIDNQIGKNHIVPERERVLTNGECLFFVNRTFRTSFWCVY